MILDGFHKNIINILIVVSFLQKNNLFICLVPFILFLINLLACIYKWSHDSNPLQHLIVSTIALKIILKPQAVNNIKYCQNDELSKPKLEIH